MKNKELSAGNKKTSKALRLDQSNLLLRAAYAGDLTTLQRVIADGERINVKNNGALDRDDGFTPLMLAACYGHTDCLRALIDAGANLEIKVDNDYWTAIMLAAYNVHMPAMEMLAEAGANIKTLQKTWPEYYNSLLPIVERKRLRKTTKNKVNRRRTTGAIGL